MRNRAKESPSEHFFTKSKDVMILTKNFVLFPYKKNQEMVEEKHQENIFSFESRSATTRLEILEAT